MAIHIKKSHEGLLHKDLGVKAGEKIPAKKLQKALHSKNEKVRKRAQFAENAKHFHHGGGKSAHQPHPKTNPGFYDTEPHAPADKKADHNPMPKQTGSLGNNTPAMVPHHPARFDGVGGPPHHFGKGPAGGSHGFGHRHSERVGHMRTSGHPHAHRLGKR